MNYTSSSGDIRCENSNTSSNNSGDYHYHHDTNSNISKKIQENYCDIDDEYYKNYDTEMADAVAQADYQDHYYSQTEDEYIEEYECDCHQQEKVRYDYRTDSLLNLVVGVQSYLLEQANSSKCDSPLYNLQYKMYTYMRQRALELGVQFEPTS